MAGLQVILVGRAYALFFNPERETVAVVSGPPITHECNPNAAAYPRRGLRTRTIIQTGRWRKWWRERDPAARLGSALFSLGTFTSLF